MKKKRKKRRAGVSASKTGPGKKTGLTGTSLAHLAAQFTDEQKAAIIEAARFAYAQPEPEPGSLRESWIRQMDELSERKAYEEGWRIGPDGGLIPPPGWEFGPDGSMIPTSNRPS